MKDLEFKKLCEEKIGRKVKNKYNADYEFISDDGFRFVVEYENSSRGLVHNFVKIAKKCQEDGNGEKIVAIFISTEHHSKVHKPDIERFKFLADNLQVNFVTWYFSNEREFFEHMEDVL